MLDRLTEAGSRPNKEPTYAPIFIAASLTGLYTQRHVFHDPSNVVTQRFYGGRPDALYNGRNVELTNNLTLARRPGNRAISGTYSDVPLRAFSWEDNEGNWSLLVDTEYGPPYFLNTGRICLEPCNGAAATTLFTKSTSAQGFFVASGDTVYYGNGVDLIKYTPGNPNGLIWKWGIAAPPTAPSVNSVASGSAAVAWASDTVFSTMGLIVDPNGNVQQLFSVNFDPTNPNSTQIGTSSNGSPNFNLAYNATTSDGTVTWTSQGAIALWAPNTVFQPGNAIWDPDTSCIFIASHNYAVTTGATKPNFTSTLGLSGARITESTGARWENIGRVGVSPTAVLLWKKDTAYLQYVLPATGSDPTNVNSAIVSPLAPFLSSSGQLCNGQATYLLGATVAGTTANTSYTPWQGISSQTIGQITSDGQLAWICLGSATWAASTLYTGWVYGNATFSAIKDANGNMQVAIQGGTSASVVPGESYALTSVDNAAGGQTTYNGTFSPIPPSGQRVVISGFTNSANNGTMTIVSCTATAMVTSNPSGVAETHSATAVFNPWATFYGGQTNDGSVTWTCVGPPVSWAASEKWFLPAPGFAPPLPSQPYGGAQVIADGYVQAVYSATGPSGGSTPTWSETIGNETNDGDITWITISAFSEQSITWTKSHVYAYSFKCRTPTDDYVTTSLLTFGGLNSGLNFGLLGNVPGLVSPLGPYLGGGTGAVSTASPVFTISTPNTEGAVNFVSGQGSTDPQVDTIVIWRDADGGGSDNMFELIEIPAPPPIGGVAQPWTFADFLPDIASTVSGVNYPGLDELSPAPIDHQNDPPPAGFIPYCDELHFSRIWGAVGNTVFFSGGPDVLVSNPNEAFNPTDDFPFKSAVTGCIHTPVGLIVPTVTDFECIYGGPSTASFYSTTMLPGTGIANPNAWGLFGGEIFFVSTDGQFWSMTPSLQVSRTGFPIGNNFQLGPGTAAIDPVYAIVAVHESVTDNAIFIADGEVGWYRLNPHQVGADIAGENAMVWSPYAEIEPDGCGPLVQSVWMPSIDGLPPYKGLLLGNPNRNGKILLRDQAIFTDAGTSYDAYFEVGAITLAFPGQRAAVKFIECDFTMPTGAEAPIVSYVLDDPTPSPTWTAMSAYVYDPPIVYGGSAIQPNYWPNRYYLNQNEDVAVCRRVRIRVDFGTEATADEMISFAVFGRKYVEQ